jgi:hypothetical protein
MSCARCEVHRGDIRTGAAFADVQRRLAALVGRGDLLPAEGEPMRLALSDQPLDTAFYRCRSCDAVWRLVRPTVLPPTPSASFEFPYPGSLAEMLRVGSSAGTALHGPLSYLEDSVHLPSPDGRYIATMTDAEEIQMGGPMRGTLRVNDMVLEDCGTSMVWSDDSEYLAVVRIFDRSRPARLTILSMSHRRTRDAPGTYHGGELQSFSQGIVRCTDGQQSTAIDVRPVLAGFARKRWWYRRR